MKHQLHDYYKEVNIPERLKGNILNDKNEKLETINNLSKVNLLVGTNNSGKSLLLRELLKTKEAGKDVPSNILKEINDKLLSYKKEFLEILKELDWVFIQDSAAKRITLTDLDSIFSITISGVKSIDFIKQHLQKEHSLSRLYNFKPHGYRSISLRRVIPVTPNIRKEMINFFEELATWVKNIETEFTYNKSNLRPYN